MSAALGYHGSKDAPPGSEPWAMWWREVIRSTANSANLDLAALAEQCGQFESCRGYQQLRDHAGRPFSTLRDFLEERPMHGIGLRVDIIQQLADAVKPAAEKRRQAKSKASEGKSLRTIGKELGVSHTTARRIGTDAVPHVSGSAPVRLHPDPARAAKTIITARGLSYAKQLAAAIVEFECQS